MIARRAKQASWLGESRIQSPDIRHENITSENLRRLALLHDPSLLDPHDPISRPERFRLV